MSTPTPPRSARPTGPFTETEVGICYTFLATGGMQDDYVKACAEVLGRPIAGTRRVMKKLAEMPVDNEGNAAASKTVVLL